MLSETFAEHSPDFDKTVVVFHPRFFHVSPHPYCDTSDNAWVREPSVAFLKLPSPAGTGRPRGCPLRSEGEDAIGISIGSLAKRFNKSSTLPLAGGQPVAPRSGLPGVDAPTGRGDHADQEAAGPGPHARAKRDEARHGSPACAHRAREQSRQALSYRSRHQPPPEGGGPRSGYGSLLRTASLPDTSDALATDGLSGMNSIVSGSSPRSRKCWRHLGST